MSADIQTLPQLAESPPALDVTRAIGVLNAAMKHKMFPEGAVPETDTDKITEAEKLIELCRQAFAVAQQIGPGNVPNYQAIIDVLAEAELFLGIGSPLGPASPSPPPPSPPSDLAQEAAEANAMAAQLATMYGTGEGTPTGDASSTASPAEVPAQPATPPPPVTSPAPVSEVEAPERDEMWVDEGGGQWIITRGGNYQQIEVRSVATGEETLVPSGFLKQRVATAEQVKSTMTMTQEAQPSPPPSSFSAPPSPSSPSSPAPPPSISAPASGAAPATMSAPPPPLPSEPQPSSSSPSAAEQPPVQHAAVVPVYNTEDDPQYTNLVEQVEHDYGPVAMPVPMDLERPPEGMPEDLTMVGDIEQRRLHSQFNALAARSRYLRGFEDALARACKRLRQSYMKTAMKDARVELGKDASVTEVTQRAEDDESVSTWTERMVRHQERADAYKTFFDIYAEHVVVLSRDWTMRDQEQRGS